MHLLMALMDNFLMNIVMDKIILLSNCVVSYPYKVSDSVFDALESEWMRYIGGK